MNETETSKNLNITDKPAIIVLIGIILGAFCALGGGNEIIVLGLLALTSAAIIFLSNYEVSVYVICCYGFADWIIRSFITPIASVWDEFFLILMVMLWLFKWLVYRKSDGFKQAPLDFPIVFFISVMLFVLIVNSPDFSISLEGFRCVVQYIFWYFVALQLLKDDSSVKKISMCFAFLVGLMAVHGIIQYVIGVEMPAGWVDQNEAGVRTRVYSFLTSPNIFGSLLTLASPICFSLGLTEKSRGRKILFFALTLAMLGSLVFTFSRGAWIGFAVAVMIYILSKDIRLLIPAIILAVMVVFLVPSVGDRITYMLSPEYIESSLKGGRLVRWIKGLRILSFYPWLGLGLGHFGGAVAMNHSLSTVVDTFVEKTYYMDNYYLKTAVETGIIGLSSLFILMYSVIINSVRAIKLTTNKEHKEIGLGILCGLIGVIVHNFVENVFEVPMMTTVFWVFAAVMMHIWYQSFNKVKGD